MKKTTAVFIVTMAMTVGIIVAAIMLNGWGILFFLIIPSLMFESE